MALVSGREGVRMLGMHPDRLFPVDPGTRAIARRLYDRVRSLPIVSPHGHCDPAWFADDEPFPDPAHLLLVPDHYLIRMLYSQGVPLERLGIGSGPDVESDPRAIWRTFADHVDLFRATPSAMWLDATLAEIFDIDVRLDAASADEIYDRINERLTTDQFRPRALFDRFHIEFLATTETPLYDLVHHDAIHASDWGGVVVPTFRPDVVVDPEHPQFADALVGLAELTGCDVESWTGYLAALRARRAEFIARGATATDHGHPHATTALLDERDAQLLYARARAGELSAADADVFRGVMLSEMVKMSIDDGLVVQLHVGSWRDHNGPLRRRAGADLGGDIPRRVDFVGGLHPLLEEFGNRTDVTVVVFTLDESTYARELAPLAGHYPLLRLGAPWWFHDSPEGMWRYRRRVTETAGFANTVGFTDDTRGFLGIPARHDMARRIDCAYLAQLVGEHRLDEDDAHDVAHMLAYDLARSTYRVDPAASRVHR